MEMEHNSLSNWVGNTSPEYEYSALKKSDGVEGRVQMIMPCFDRQQPRLRLRLVFWAGLDCCFDR
jgi:hypothetical protein